jgi:DNA-binding MarR family transcriptional regulator
MNERPGSRPGAGQADFAYLLVQLGTHLARQFSERLAPLGLEPRQAGMLTRLAANQGLSQQAIGELIGLNPTRMVFLVDELEQRGLVERRRNAADRRSYALYLTAQGRDMLRKIQATANRHQDQIGASRADWPPNKESPSSTCRESRHRRPDEGADRPPARSARARLIR